MDRESILENRGQFGGRINPPPASIPLEDPNRPILVQSVLRCGSLPATCGQYVCGGSDPDHMRIVKADAEFLYTREFSVKWDKIGIVSQFLGSSVAEDLHTIFVAEHGKLSESPVTL